MQLKEEDYWDMLDDVLQITEEMEEKWRQLAWAYHRTATIVWSGADYPAADELIDNLEGEIEDWQTRLRDDFQLVKRRYHAKLIDDGKPEFSIKWEDDETF